MFKAPSSIPQDLLLIQDLISEPVLVSPLISSDKKHEKFESSSSTATTSSDCDSSEDETDSEEVDVVEGLLTKDTDDVEDLEERPLTPSSSCSESSDSSDSDDSDGIDQDEKPKQTFKEEPCYDEEEDEGGNVSFNQVLRTKNELLEAKIVVPDITEVDSAEPLERIGEIMSIIGDTVIVKGLASANEDRASEFALDSESLLVFEDRRVLGFVHETFGPTYQPFYQVKFPSASCIDLEGIKASRLVFHVPRRSNFVFPSQLKKLKGSDASNVYDEEVAADEAEFSDDEAEAEYKKQKKRKREENRASSIASSRNTTPIPSQMYDQELNDQAILSASPFAEYGPYDIDTKPGPSRPAPLPYDDPYQDSSGDLGSHMELATRSTPNYLNQEQRENRQHINSQGNTRDRGSGRGRGRGRGRSRGGSRYGTDRRNFSGQHGGNREYQSNMHHNNFQRATHSPQTTDQVVNDGSWPHYGLPYNSYGMQMSQQQNSHIQPHFNPRFAQFYGLNTNLTPNQAYNSYSPSSPNVNDFGYAQNFTPGFNWSQNDSSSSSTNATLQLEVEQDYSSQQR